MTREEVFAGLAKRGDTFVKKADESYIRNVLEKLGGADVVLTGFSPEAGKTGFAVRQDQGIRFYSHDRIGKNYHGTGDMFAAVLTGALGCGKGLYNAAETAAEFTKKCIENTYRNPAHWYGIKFETELPELIRMLRNG